MNTFRTCTFRQSAQRAIDLVAFLTLTILLAGCASPAPQISVTNTPTIAPTSVPATATLTSAAVPIPTTTPTPTLPSVSPLTFISKITGDTADPLASPNALAFDKQGNLYVEDASNRRIVKFDANGKILAQWGSAGSGEGQFNFQHTPGDIAVDDQGDVYVVDDGNARIEKFDGNGKFITQWGARGAGDGQFTTPQDVSVDAQGNVYVLDVYWSSVQKFDSNGKFLGRLGSYGGGEGQFLRPSGLAIDGQGNIYVGDTAAFIHKFGKDDKFLASFKVNCPRIGGLTVDTQGNIYAFQFTDTGNRNPSICKFDGAGKTLGIWTNNGSENGQWGVIADIHVDAQGYLYIADRGNNRIQKLQQP